MNDVRHRYRDDKVTLILRPDDVGPSAAHERGAEQRGLGTGGINH
jgi:hypothetical protein